MQNPVIKPKTKTLYKVKAEKERQKSEYGLNYLHHILVFFLSFVAIPFSKVCPEVQERRGKRDGEEISYQHCGSGRKVRGRHGVSVWIVESRREGKAGRKEYWDTG